jgi:hypothetical protein
VLSVFLRLVSLLGLVPSGMGTWMLLTADHHRDDPARVVRSAATTTAATATDAAIRRWRSCSNFVFNYRISYPAD